MLITKDKDKPFEPYPADGENARFVNRKREARIAKTQERGSHVVPNPPTAPPANKKAEPTTTRHSIAAATVRPAAQPSRPGSVWDLIDEYQTLSTDCDRLLFWKKHRDALTAGEVVSEVILVRLSAGKEITGISRLILATQRQRAGRKR